MLRSVDEGEDEVVCYTNAIFMALPITEFLE